MPAMPAVPPSVMGMVALLSMLYMGGAARNLREEKEALEERVEALEEEVKAREFHAHVMENDIKSYEILFRETGGGARAAEAPAPDAPLAGTLDDAIMSALSERKWHTAREILEVVSRSTTTTKKEVNSRLYTLKARGRISFKEGPVPKWRK